MGRGLCFNKYTGSRGKGGSNDADAEYVALVRDIMDEAGVDFQTCELGRIGAGGCKTICGSSPASTGAFVPSMPSNRIGWRWARSSPLTMPETSTRFGATSSRGLSPRRAPTLRSSTSPAQEYAKAVLPRPHHRCRGRHMSLWRRHPQRQAHPALDRQQKARGSMVRWMAENKLEDVSGLTAFDVGYRHSPELSNKNTLVFLNEQAL